MNLSRIRPGGLGPGPGPRLPGLVSCLLAAAQFDRAAWRGLGFRGLRPSRRSGEAWTLRLAGRPGVFGLLFREEDESGPAPRASFSTHYFPDPAEPLAEALPLAGLALVESPDYWDLVRDFPARPDLAGLCETGTLTLAAHPAGSWLETGLDAPVRRRVLARDGVPLPGGGWLVPPGGRESDLPAWRLALPLFRVLAAAWALLLDEAPSRRLLRRDPAPAWAYDAAGRWAEVPDPGLARLHLRLGFGPAGRLPAPGPGFAPAPGGARLHLPRPDRAADPAGRPELLVLTGFLGAGKTTLLRRLLEEQVSRCRLVGVIQNELGEVGLDGRLVQGECVLEEMDEGCVCCSLAGRLRAGLLKITERLTPDLVVLETSGLANPLNVLEELPELADLARPGPVVTVVDAAHFAAAAAESRVALDQVRAADALVLAKADLVAEADLAALESRLRELNPLAPVLRSREGWIPWGALLDQVRPPRPARVLSLGDLRQDRATHGQDGFGVRVERLDAPLGEAELAARVRAAGPVARLKGVVDLEGWDGPVLVQGVRDRVELSDLPGPVPAERFLVYIGRG